MKRGKGIVARPLDVIFSAPSHVAILRVLRNVKEGLSGREIARRAGYNHQTCADSLTRLEDRGIVLRLGAGRNQLFQLNRDNNLVRTVLIPLFKAEHKQFTLMLEDLALVVKEHCLSAVLFGSVARMDDIPASDLDIALIVERTSQLLHQITGMLIHRGMVKWGIRISPLLLTRADFTTRAGKKDPLVVAIMRDGMIISGKPLRSLLE